MQSDLDRYGVEVVALNKDGVKEAQIQRKRDGIDFKLLTDPKLEVIRQYGLEHHKAVEFSTVSFVLFGIPLALFPSVKTMAIPTTILIDEKGIIHWIDQADDYRIRGDSKRVLNAIKETFGEITKAS
ncbi:MAG: redoxin domain-containing protein [Proteobacteria bacterium]|nr:redoxin domain-containing protein [Pseudomonadota bacterium]